MKPINQTTWRQKMVAYRRKPRSFILFLLVNLAAILTAVVVLFLLVYVLVNGIPHLSWDLFSLHYTTENVSLLPAFINTIIMTFLSLLVAAPLGIFAAIYLVEYAKRGNRLVNLIRITAETLSGVPSIVYGLFGSLFFVIALGMGLSILAGALTLAIMILPSSCAPQKKR